MEFVDVWCPCCGEPLELAVDATAGAQSYVEDCQVCCKPMVVRVRIDEDGLPQVDVSAESQG